MLHLLINKLISVNKYAHIFGNYEYKLNIRAYLSFIVHNI